MSMSNLIREQRLDKNGVLNTKLVRAHAPQPVRNSPFPPVADTSSSNEIFRSFGKAFTNPAEIPWERMSNNDVTKIANHASSELGKNKKNANAMFDLYAEMFRNEHVDSQHAKDLLEGNDVLRSVKEAFIEYNGLATDTEWTPEQYAAREQYIVHLNAFNEAKEAAESELNPPATGWNWG